ncbi:MAG: formate--tetrahydrofolate ligase, partial [Anaerolineales bacterium]|nr:formate--tetrahydrofolate ligase [Anaerolineales bacterium]
MPTKKTTKAKSKLVAKKKKGAAKKPAAPSFKPTKLKLLAAVPSDIEIAQAAKLKHITQVAAEAGLKPSELISYGDYKAKVKLGVLERLAKKPNGKYID